jgi:DNA topoisomerase I
MSKDYLVIVESPGKIKKLKSILGSSYEVIACMGHIVDLPPKSFGIDVVKMQPDYVVLKNDIAKKIRTEAQKPYKLIYLASDPDREGEAISYHVANLLKRSRIKTPVQRITFDAITASAVQSALANPRTINNDLVAAQETRRLLDRLVGFPSSRLVWQFVEGFGLSAGRVQSVALRLVVEREQAIANFVPEEYWTITGLFRAKSGEFITKLSHWQGKKAKIAKREDAENILKQLHGVAFSIGTVTPKQRLQKPPAPFTTSSLQQTASSHLRLSPDMTMRLAQQLYEGGYITYMRTDSTAVSAEGQSMAKVSIQKLYGNSYLGNHSYGVKSNAQEAHECIRPTDTETTPTSLRATLGADNERLAGLYELIYKRFLASQMASAVFNEVHVTVLGGQAVFAAKGSQLAFDGFLRVYGYTEEKEQSKREDEDSDEDEPINKQLPALTNGESVQALKLTPLQHFTKPPTPYTEALLVKAMENAGVGRPSTYAQTIATLKDREYVQVDKRRLFPTDLGKEVNGVLVSKLPSLFEVGFTAQMESTLDKIAIGEQNGRDYLKAFWAQVSPMFGEKVIKATLAPPKEKPNPPPPQKLPEKPKRPPKPRKPPEYTYEKPNVPIDPQLGVCPTCGGALVKRKSKFGEFIGCSDFPRCRFTKKV